MNCWTVRLFRQPILGYSMEAEEKRQVGVIGSGMIGIGLCVLFTAHKIPVCLLVRKNSEEKKKKYREILKSLEGIQYFETPAEIEEKYFRITKSVCELGNMDVIFESVAENTQVKRKIYEEVAESCPHIKALASTTSSLLPSVLFEGCALKDRLLVAHPFYPVPLTSCVEIVPGPDCLGKAVSIVKGLLGSVERTPVILHKEVPGFVANRLQYAMLREAIYLVEKRVVSPEEIDLILRTSFAARYTKIGLFEHFDNCGLDLAKDICEFVFPDLSDEKTVPNLLKEKCEQQEYGVKSGKGIYDWDEESIRSLEDRIQRIYQSKR